MIPIVGGTGERASAGWGIVILNAGARICGCNAEYRKQLVAQIQESSRTLMSTPPKNVAVLIDGENVNPAYIPSVLHKMKEYGRIVFKKVYADWSKPQSKSWEPVITRHLLDLHQQFNVTSGKNATDIAMTIDAMDLLYGEVGEKLDIVCIVSSDSDFSHLAVRFRKAGVRVVGIGREKSSLRGSCDLFFAFPEEQPALIAPAATLLSPPPAPASSPAAPPPFPRRHRPIRLRPSSPVQHSPFPRLLHLKHLHQPPHFPKRLPGCAPSIRTPKRRKIKTGGSLSVL